MKYISIIFILIGSVQVPESNYILFYQDEDKRYKSISKSK